ISAREARRQQQAKQSSMDVGRVRRDKLPSLTLAEFKDAAIALTRHEVEPATLLELTRAMDCAIAVLGGDTDVTDLRPADALRLVNKLTDDELEPPTIQKKLNYLKAAFNRGVEHGIVDGTSNPFARIEVNGHDRAKEGVIRTVEEIGDLKNG